MLINEKEWEIEAETDEVEFESYDTIESEGSNDGWDDSGYDVNYDDKDNWS
jgi:hypothetical protein